MPVADAEVEVLTVGGGPVGLTARALLERWGVRTLGLVFGVTYDSGAVLADGTTPPELSDVGTDYVPTAEPGHRMPHLWLTHNRSTLDAFGEWFTLLTPDPRYWEPQATAPWPLHIETLPDEHIDLCGFGPRGALLIRPDGHVGARWRDRPPGDSLPHALATMTGSTPPE